MPAQKKLSDEQELLAAIWAEFKKAGYENDREIIEYLAYLLLTYFLPEKPPPIKAAENIALPSTRYKVDETEVQRLLKRARSLFEKRGGLATFFDRSILFYPTKSWRPDTYPIPRHMVDFMLALLQIKSDHRFADFTCGQGGFIVNRYRLSPTHEGQTVGVEISPEIARLAHANALLHGMNNNDTNFALGDAFGVSGLTNPNWLFERIAMAPPFGGEVKAEWVGSLFGEVSDRSYRTLFTRLALRSLAPKGQAALLVPEGLLRNGGASRKLREELINDHAVKAVITLQAGLFRPYVATSMYILLFQKASENSRIIEQPSPTWFLRIATDGYPLDASRNLTSEPPKKFGDLPLAQATILPNEGEQEVFRPILESGLSYKPLANTPGIIFKVNTNAALFSIRSFQPTGRETYLVTQASLQGQASIYSVIPVLQGQAEIPFLQNQAEMEKVQVLHNTAAFNRWITQTFHLPSDAGAEDLPAGRYIFGQGRADQTIAITADGRLLGFTKTREEIGEAEYTLSDDSHWRRHAEPVQEISSVAQMLQEIRKNQRHINDYAENLQGQVEFKQILAEPLPPKLLALDQFPLTTFLGTEQERIWKKICWEVPPVDQHSPESNYAWPFTLDDFLKKAQNEEADDGGEEARNGDEKPVTVEQTLQLLERLGLIVQVAPSTSSTRYYRRVTELDRGTWPARPESE